jgi:hypothetical protein
MNTEIFVWVGLLAISFAILNMVAVGTSIPPSDVHPLHWLVWLVKSVCTLLTALLWSPMIMSCDYAYWRLVVPPTIMGVNFFAIWTDIPKRSIESSNALDTCIWICKGLSFSVCALFLLYVLVQLVVFLVQRARNGCKSEEGF